MKKWNMIVDVARCHNCYNCFIATKDEYVGVEYEGYSGPQPLHGHSWVAMEYRESGRWPMVETSFRPVMCNHCDDAPCMAAATGGAIEKRDDGVVIIDPKLAKGQKQIVDACPYGAVYWNEEEQIPQAWPFDAHLLDRGWKKTKLETVCPTDVFRSLKVSDVEMQRIVEDEDLVTLESNTDAKPRVYYKNNHLFTTCFVGGTIVTRQDGVEDCVSGAAVSAMQGEELLGRAVSDGFGEFRIMRLERGCGAVTLHIEIDGKPAKSIDVEVDDSVYVGCIEV
ncbi:MAG: oxidoreductase [Gammaproteobacteria bacterium]|nr:oxidoreductase [Gammaproteobacteria bacterium]